MHDSNPERHSQRINTILGVQVRVDQLSITKAFQKRVSVTEKIFDKIGNNISQLPTLIKTQIKSY